MAKKRYWLFKSEPTSYSFADLMAEPNRTAEWDGVRNYQVRNLMRDEMKVGDAILFYHSSAKPMAVVGLANIVGEAYPDTTAFDSSEKHYDPKSDPGNPAWLMVDIQGERELDRPVTLQEIKNNPKLENMLLVKKGMRLSIQPVTEEEWQEVVAMSAKG